MRKFLAILVCKLGRAVGKLVGKGSSMPGKFALKICPDILARVQLPSHIIAVTGSNGKTSTVEMIAAILRAGGKTVVYNEEGSNQIEGVTTLVLTHASLTGRVRADVLLIESDERYAAQSFRYFHPTEFVITNLYRDQLTRNGHPEWVYDAILPALHPETELILNADDPLSSCFARGPRNRPCIASSRFRRTQTEAIIYFNVPGWLHMGSPYLSVAACVRRSRIRLRPLP